MLMWIPDPTPWMQKKKGIIQIPHSRAHRMTKRGELRVRHTTRWPIVIATDCGHYCGLPGPAVVVIFSGHVAITCDSFIICPILAARAVMLLCAWQLRPSKTSFEPWLESLTGCQNNTSHYGLVAVQNATVLFMGHNPHELITHICGRALLLLWRCGFYHSLLS